MRTGEDIGQFIHTDRLDDSYCKDTVKEREFH